MEKIKYDDFSKLDLRVGEILNVEDHPNADKLFVMKVDLGEDEERTIIAGLKGFYEKDDLIGKRAVFVANLQASKLRGIESNGMILAAVSEDKSKAVILEPEKEMRIGTRVS